jgi:hypothetical protein
MAAMAASDADWRPVLTHGDSAHDAAREAGGRELLRDLRKVGRKGWINLVGPLTEVRGAWSVEALRPRLRLPGPGRLLHVRLGTAVPVRG